MTSENRERLLLAADVGGTNLSLALMAGSGGRVRLLRKAVFSTPAEPSFLAPVRRFLAEGVPEGFPAGLEAACVSGAGPVKGTVIPLTNAPWDIDGAALEADLGVPVRLVNDFTAVARGALLLDPEREEQLLPVPHPGGAAAPDPQGTVLVVGAGTGLGVGYITRGPEGARVHASEGGHVGLPMTGEETLGLWRYLRPRFPGPPGAEAAVSGRGIATLLGYLAASGRHPVTPEAAAILALPEPQRPAAIAGAQGDPLCRAAMELFVDLYARVCADLCAVFLPTGGLFLAGGIAAKNAGLFLEGGRFMASFERNYREHIDGIVRSTPVFIVRDYAVSLYGAAGAALELCPAPGAP
jgi:glucokinase